MNLLRALTQMKSALRHIFALVLLAAGLGSVAYAQVLPVTSWTLTTMTDGTDSISSGITYLNKYMTVDTFTAGGDVFSANDPTKSIVADHAYVRRNTATSSTNSNPSNFHIMSGTVSSTAVEGQLYSNAESLLLSGNILLTVADAFSNVASSTTSALLSNIERLDFVWQSGYLAHPEDVIAVFNVDTPTSQDDFRIAIFTSIDGSNIPTAYKSIGLLINTTSSLSAGTGDGTDTGTGNDYGSLLSVTYPTSTASTTTSTVSNWRVQGFSSGDTISGATSAGTYSSTSQGIGGAAIRLSDLGITTSQMIYGYSIMAPDVTPVVASDLVTWTNSTYYPTNTSTTSGTADITAFTGRFIQPVPEPSTYGAILMGAGLAAYGLRRKLAKRVTPVAPRASAPPRAVRAETAR